MGTPKREHLRLIEGYGKLHGGGGIDLSLKDKKKRKGTVFHPTDSWKGDSFPSRGDSRAKYFQKGSRFPARAWDFQVHRNRASIVYRYWSQQSGDQDSHGKDSSWQQEVQKTDSFPL